MRLAALLLILVASRASGLVTFTNACANSPTSTGTTTACSPIGAVASGHTIIVGLETVDGTGTVSVADTAGNTYTKDRDKNYTGGNSRLVIFRSDNSLPLSTSDTITVTHPSVASRTIRVLDLGNASLSSFDVGADATGTGTAFDTTSTTTTAQAAAIVIGFFGVKDTNVGTCTAGAGYGGLLQAGTTGGATNRTMCVEYKTVSVTGAYNATATWSANRDWVGAVMVYKELIPTPTPTVTRTPTTTPTATNTPTITKTPTPGLVFAGGFEHCANPSSRWLTGGAAGSVTDTSGTGVAAKRTPAPMAGETGNYCHLEINAASAQTEYIELNETATATIGAHFDLYVNTVPATARRIFSFYSNAATKRGCFATIEASGSAVLLKTFYEDTANECGGATNNYTECSVDGDCTSVNTGEAACTSSAYAIATLGTTTWYHVAIGQTNGTGEVQCQLRVDGTDSGTQSRWQGKCAAGGDHPLYACRTAADCGTSTPCTTTDVTTIDRVRFGIDDAVASAADIFIDAVVVQTDGAAGLDKVRVQALNPNGAGSSTQWTANTGTNTNAMDDLTSGGAQDDATTYVESIASSKLDSYAMQDLTLATDESIQGVAVTALVSDTGNTGTDKVTKTCIGDGTNQLCGTSADVAGFTDANYSPALYSFFATTADGTTSWTDANIDSLQGQINRVSATGSSSVRATALVAEAVIRQPIPETPNTLADQNADGVISVCVAGDSRLNDVELRIYLASRLTQPGYVYQCTRGGVASTDLMNHMSAVLDGTGDSFMICNAAKGSVGKPCDYILYGVDVNDFHTAMPRAGVCYDNGGANEGAACRCDNPLHDFNTAAATTAYCREGTAWKTPCTGNADCTGAGSTNVFSCTQSTPSTMCVPGCVGAPGCATGVCLQDINVAAFFARQEQILTTIRQRANPPKVIFVLPPWTDGGAIGCWGSAADGLAAAYNWYKQRATRLGLNWIDLRGAFQDNCKPRNSCLRDGVHWTTSATGGAAIAADAIEACLEHYCLGGANVGVACRLDGECPSSTCGNANANVSCSNL